VKIELYQGDLPGGLDFGDSVAIDCETMGLHPRRDRLCLVQLSGGDGTCHLVQLGKGEYGAPNLTALLADPKVLKIFHYARFDVATMRHHLGVMAEPVYCTKIASRLVRTFTDRHSLKDLCGELLKVDISKQQQQSDWGADRLSKEQLEYAASDVAYLHRIMEILNARLAREGRTELAQACFEFIRHRVALDLAGWLDNDIFDH
jgi:ribonuclease D